MGSLTQSERALLYALRLKATSTPKTEAANILSELSSLVYSGGTDKGKALSKDDKIAILKEVKEYLSGGTIKTATFILEASDNSGILDVVDNVINGLGK